MFILPVKGFVTQFIFGFLPSPLLFSSGFAVVSGFSLYRVKIPPGLGTARESNFERAIQEHCFSSHLRRQDSAFWKSLSRCKDHWSISVARISLHLSWRSFQQWMSFAAFLCERRQLPFRFSLSADQSPPVCLSVCLSVCLYLSSSLFTWYFLTSKLKSRRRNESWCGTTLAVQAILLQE